MTSTAATPAASPAAYRDAWRARLTQGLQQRFGADAVPAAFEGGSAATGRSDAYSDIDLVVVAEPGLHAAVFEALEAIICATDTITHRWQVADPLLPGMSQRFYLLADAPPFFMLDCVAIAPASLPPLLERERHGDPHVLFDHAGLVRPQPLDQAALAAKRARRLAQIRASWPVFRQLVDKELARDRPLDAFGFHLALLRMTVDLAGMLHRPERHDFGWRYLHIDLPPALARELQALAYCGGTAALQAGLPRLDALQAQLLAALDDRAERTDGALSSE
jgi:hypothetical protein